MSDIPIKRGSTFEVQLNFAPGTGSDLTLLDIDVSSEVCTPGGALVTELEIAVADDGLSCVLTAPAGTAAWPLGTLAWDVRMSYGGRVHYSRAVYIDVARAITAAA